MLNKLGRITRIGRESRRRGRAPRSVRHRKVPCTHLRPYPKDPHCRLAVQGLRLVEDELTLDWREFNDLPQVTFDAEFHCVTQWSKLQNTWQGILFTDLMKLITPKPEARYVMAHCYGGYTANVALDVLLDDDVLFAHSHDGKPLTPEHGGPMRLVVPKRYGWKSAKWVNGLEFMAQDAPGFWEMRGYHMEGDPWKEERFWSTF